MNGILKKGSKEPLEESDIREVLERDSAHHLATKLQRYFLWNLPLPQGRRKLVKVGGGTFRIKKGI
jgi:hypothetical protein